MPWKASDAPSTAKSASAKRKWAKIANAIYSECMDMKNNDGECAAKAKRIANSKVGEKK